MKLLTEASSVAAPAGLYQLILDAGPEVLAMLMRLRDGVRTGGSSRDLMPHVEELIVRCREAYPSEPTHGRASPSPSRSARESE